MEINAEENKVIVLYNQKDSKTYMVMPEQKMYMELEGIDNMINSNMKHGDKSVDIKKTGEFKDINGYKCEKWIIKNEDDIVEAG